MNNENILTHYIQLNIEKDRLQRSQGIITYLNACIIFIMYFSIFYAKHPLDIRAT